MIIQSILDLDLYCLSCSYAMMINYPEAEGVWKFIDRGNVDFTPEFVQDLKMEIASLSSLKLTKEEFEWCKNKIKYIPSFYWEWLKGFKFRSDLFHINYNPKTKKLDVEIEGNMAEIALYDVVFLAIMSELYQKHKGNKLITEDFIQKIIDPDIELSNQEKLYFSEFGTRRRYSAWLQDAVVKRFKEKATYCNGTSNVYLAMKYGMTPIGTQSHFYRQFHNSVYGYRMGEYMANESWVKAFDGDLGVALTDTISSKIFFKNLSRKHALLIRGYRHDSGVEFDYINLFVNRYKELGLDPLTKDLVFSNALTMKKFKEISDYCKGRCRRASAGIGGHFVNLPEFKPNFVAKLVKCRMTPREEWLSAIKLSDDLDKAMGDPKEVYIAKLTLGLVKWVEPETKKGIEFEDNATILKELSNMKKRMDEMEKIINTPRSEDIILGPQPYPNLEECPELYDDEEELINPVTGDLDEEVNKPIEEMLEEFEKLQSDHKPEPGEIRFDDKEKI